MHGDVFFAMHFFGPILLKIERKVENHWSHSTINILGFVLYKYQLSAVLNNTTINYGRIIYVSQNEIIFTQNIS